MTRAQRTGTPARIRNAEFVALLSMIMAVGALAIDLMLPAFPDIRAGFELAPDSTAVTGIVSTFLLGLAVGQIPYGPFTDRFGRKPVLYAGFALYAAGAAAAALAPTLPLLLAARFVWGLGAAGPRVLAIAVIRDVYVGDQMSRTMSFVMAVFILVPVIAPTLGAAIVSIAPWQTLFWLCALFVALLAVWSIRLPETLDPANRLELRFDRVRYAAREVVTNRVAVGYTAAMTTSFGAFVSYLATSEIIVSDVFDRTRLFPAVFGGFAAVMGLAMLTNARIVAAVGAKRLLRRVLAAHVGVSAGLVAVALATDGIPPFGVFLVGFAAVLFLQALLMPNFNSVAMEPLGHVAGTASAIIGTVSTGGGAALGALFDLTFDGTITPLSAAFLVVGIVAFAIVAWTEHGSVSPNLRSRRHHDAGSRGGSEGQG